MTFFSLTTNKYGGRPLHQTQYYLMYMFIIQVNMSDNFGRIMLDNLRNRGCQLAGVDACLSTQTQMDRCLIIKNFFKQL